MIAVGVAAFFIWGAKMAFQSVLAFLDEGAGHHLFRFFR